MVGLSYKKLLNLFSSKKKEQMTEVAKNIDLETVIFSQSTFFQSTKRASEIVEFPNGIIDSGSQCMRAT